MRLLHLTDTHLGNVLPTSGDPDGWVRHDDHFDAMQCALDAARRGEVDAVLHTGDLFNRSKPPQHIIRQAADVFCQLARQLPVVVFPGNHDRRGLRRYIPHAINGLHIVDDAKTVDVGGVRVGCVPFKRDARDFSAAAHRLGKVDLLCAHQAFHGACVPPGFTFRDGHQPDTIGERHLPEHTRWVACGHIHPRQVVTVGGAQIVQPGSTERTSFAERDDTKGYAIWEFDSDISYRFLDLPSRPMALIRASCDLALAKPGTLVRLGPEARHLRGPALDRGAYLCGFDPRFGKPGKTDSSPRKREPATLFSRPA